MPDISLLQSDLEIETKESIIPSIFLTTSIIFLIISLGVFAGLFFYISVLNENLQEVANSIKKLNIENTSTEVNRLNKIEGQFEVLRKLRQEHTNPVHFLSVVADSVHPRIYYKNASFDIKKREVKMEGIAVNPSSLAKQVILYNENDRINEYEISGVSLIDDGVKFNVLLRIKKE